MDIVQLAVEDDDGTYVTSQSAKNFVIGMHAEFSTARTWIDVTVLARCSANMYCLS